LTARYTGIGVGPGVAVGPVARVHGPTVPRDDRSSGDANAESERSLAALDTVAGELESLGQRAGVSGGAVLVRMARMARDPALAGLVTQLVRSGRSAARAAWEGFGAYRDMRAADPLRGTPDAVELDDVRDRVVARLLGEPPPGLPESGAPYVLVARDLSPALTATLDPSRVLALVTERGGPTSHTAVVAKALGIPAVVGCPGVAALAGGQRVAVDGGAGTVTADPDRELVGLLHRLASPARHGSDRGPGRTRDGRAVVLLAAVGGGGDVDDALEAGAEGVGVFRTEFCFLDRDDPPSGVEECEA
jgi:phosphotransferase system enzyme I (PtsI)